MNPDLSLLHLFWHASLLVKAVLLLLLGISVVSWGQIITKWQLLKAAGRDAAVFEKRFWSGIDLVELYKQIVKQRANVSGMSSLFEAGFGEFARLRKQGGVEPMAVLEGAQRAMRVSLNREIDRLEANLSFLATVGSTSPYIGLFGTVWGIIDAFQGLGSAGTASLRSVAPGISEALVTTAAGLFAAIPAVIAYNQYLQHLKEFGAQMDDFGLEFLNMTERHFT